MNKLKRICLIILHTSSDQSRAIYGLLPENPSINQINKLLHVCFATAEENVVLLYSTTGVIKLF